VRKKRNKHKKITQAKNKSTQAQGPNCARKRNDRIDSIFHATHATQALALCAMSALRAFEWKPA